MLLFLVTSDRFQGIQGDPVLAETQGERCWEAPGNSFFSNTHAYPSPTQLSLDLIPFLQRTLLSEAMLLGAMGSQPSWDREGKAKRCPKKHKWSRSTVQPLN